MPARVADEEYRQEEPGYGEDNTQVDRLWSQRVGRRQVAGGERRQRNCDVTGELVEAHGQPAPRRPDQVDLHDHRGRPAQTLVDAQQHVWHDDPAPGRRKYDQQRHGQPDHPPSYQDLLAADSIAHPPGEQVRQRLRHTKGDDERKDGRARGQEKVMFGEQRQHSPLNANHAADEGVDDHQQRELLPVRAQAQAEAVGRLAHARAAWGSLGAPCWTFPPASRQSSTPSVMTARFR